MKQAVLLALACLLPCAAARAEDPPAPRCKYVQVAKLPIRYVGQSLQPAVDGSINGEPATLLLDTGAYQPFLTMTAALRHHLPLQLSSGIVEGVGGVSRLYRTRVEDLAIGPSHVRRLELDVIRHTGGAPAFDGILGATVLLDMDMEIDLHARQMRFFEPRDCNHPKLKIWKEDTVSVPFDTSVNTGANPHFTVLVNGKPLDAMIDTGATRSALVLSAARRVGIDVEDARVKKLSGSWGVGSRQAQLWSAPLESLQIGEETIQHQNIEVIETHSVRDNVDLILGQDFLRAHHVLFAVSQRQLYLAYIGGEVFMPGTQDVAWVRQEAETGNPDAQYVMATITGGSPEGTAWLQKAAAAGHPHANLALARAEMQAGRFADAIPKLRAAIAQLPADGYAPLLLAIARTRTGQPELARSELEASVKLQKDDAWPFPVARFYLGQEDSARVLADAGKDTARHCEALRLMADWHEARGDKASADALRAQGACKADRAAP